MTLYTDDELLAANDAGMEWDHNRHDERTRAEAILDAVAPAIAASALREYAHGLAIARIVATGETADTLDAIIEDAFTRADEIEAAP